MARIKSALELALERTESVRSDKGSISSYEAKQRGKRLANAFLEDPAKTDLAKELKSTPKEDLQALKEGIFDLLLSQIRLPDLPDDEKRIGTAGEGLQLVIGSKSFGALYKQFMQAISQFLSQVDQYTEAMKRQYEPKLRQKEEVIAQQLGQEIRLDPMQDPEFVKFYNQNMRELRGQYEAMVDQVREQAKAEFVGR
jgi:hypothetical protein